MKWLCLAVVIPPLIASIVCGLFGSRMRREWSHWLGVIGTIISFAASLMLLRALVQQEWQPADLTLYVWGFNPEWGFQVGFMIDALSVTMMLVVSLISLLVHIYSVGYMAEDPGYARFFSYISLFTFTMLMLVSSNNLLQLFFGWEGVGLVSYLLIGFWYTRPSAVTANMKAFVINRVGDFAFVLGIAILFSAYDTLAFDRLLGSAGALAQMDLAWLPKSASAQEWACLLLFIGAMAKSSQIPLHIWLPDSMEGPTPISALIHAATMVTAGIFLVCRFSPLFETAPGTLSFMLLIGASTALLLGLVGLVQTDIKRVVAYSTISQLGYMTAALGASAYAAGLFHLVTHAFFKALLFLAAGSVIIAMHHEQDMRQMGGLRRKMPITYLTCLIGALSLSGFPGFAGFFSKDALIEAVSASTVPGAQIAAVILLFSVFVTALYTFRMIFLVFHGEPRHDASHVHESPHVVTGPLVVLAVFALCAGAFLAEPILFSSPMQNAMPMAAHGGMRHLADHWEGSAAFVVHGLFSPAVILMLAGIVTAWLFYGGAAARGQRLLSKFKPAQWILDRGWGFDALFMNFFASAGQKLGVRLWHGVDQNYIDTGMVMGTARRVRSMASRVSSLQSGYLYHYAFVMIIALFMLITWFGFSFVL